LFVSNIRRAALALVVAVLSPSVAMAQPETSPAQEPGDKADSGTSAPVAPAAATPASAPATWAGAAPPPEAPPRPDPEVAALRGEVRAMRAEIDRERQEREKPPPPPPPSPPPKPLGYEVFWPWVLPPEGISTGGYVQAQFESHQDSQDQLAQGGAPLNQDRFSIRRARASLLGEWEYAALALELDANTTSGPQVDLRKAEASLQYRPDRARPPIALLTLGLLDVPFGYEVVESPRTRWFLERSTASRAFFPAEPDLGVRLAGAYEFLRWTVSVQNGEPLGEKSPFVLQDPNQAKDVVVRVGFDTTPTPDVQVAGGVSALAGKGFHAGTDATKSTIQWHDLNEDGVIQPYELTPVPGQAATASQNFDRWAVNADLRGHFRSPLGITKIYGEFVVAQNLDRGLYIADPILTGIAQRELGWCIALMQEVTRYGVVGFRFDDYDPNWDAFDKRGGKLIPLSEAIQTFSPLVGLALPDRARLIFQYDVIKDAFARSSLGVPTDLKNNVWTVRLQVQL
jgi:hypothetical protein